MKRKNLLPLAAFAYALLFGYSAAAKIFDLPGLRSRLYDSPLPSGIVPLLVWFLPLVEILTAALLIWPRTRKLGLFVALSLMVIFTAYLLYLVRYPVVSCACGGWLENIGSVWHLVLNFAFLSIGVAALLETLKQKNQSKLLWP